MSKQAVIVISGYNVRAVIAFCRWATGNAVDYHIIAKNKEDPIFHTRYKKHVAFIRETANLQPNKLRSWCDSLRKQYSYQSILILPSTEFLNRFLLKHRSRIEDKSCIIPLVSEELYETISDKHRFTKLCKQYNLGVPKEFNRIPKSLPFVAKPKVYLSSEGKQLVPQLIKNQDDLETFQKENKSDYFFQEFVQGKSLYLLAYIGKNKDIIFSQENLMQQARGASILLAKKSDFHNTDIAKSYISMLREKKYMGLIMIEVCLDESTGKYYMIEANPRLWGPLQFSIDNNIDLLGTMLRDYNFDFSKKIISHTPKSHYFWSGGLTRKSQPISYHSYSSEDFINDFPDIKNQDIFFRKDTLNLFLEESAVKDNL